MSKIPEISVQKGTSQNKSSGLELERKQQEKQTKNRSIGHYILGN